MEAATRSATCSEEANIRVPGGGKNVPAGGPAIGCAGRAFGAAGWIGIRKEDRPLIELGHGFDHLTGEQLRNATDADDAGRLQGLDRLDERRDRLSVLRERTLKVRDVLARGDKQTIDIEKGVAAPRFVYVHAGFSHGLANQLCNSGSSRASAKK